MTLVSLFFIESDMMLMILQIKKIPVTDTVIMNETSLQIQLCFLVGNYCHYFGVESLGDKHASRD